jgi:hypothetical protein
MFGAWQWICNLRPIFCNCGVALVASLRSNSTVAPSRRASGLRDGQGGTGGCARQKFDVGLAGHSQRPTESWLYNCGMRIAWQSCEMRIVVR